MTDGENIEENKTKQDEKPWSLGDSEWAILAVILVVVVWFVTMVVSGQMQRNLAAAGDAVAAVAAVLSAGATFFALRGLHLQREAMKHQREAFAAQLKAQHEAVAEDHRHQKLARLREAYAALIGYLDYFEVAFLAAATGWENKASRGSLAEKATERLVECSRMMTNCRMLEYTPERYAYVVRHWGSMVSMWHSMTADAGSWMTTSAEAGRWKEAAKTVKANSSFLVDVLSSSFESEARDGTITLPPIPENG